MRRSLKNDYMHLMALSNTKSAFIRMAIMKYPELKKLWDDIKEMEIQGLN